MKTAVFFFRAKEGPLLPAVILEVLLPSAPNGQARHVLNLNEAVALHSQLEGAIRQLGEALQLDQALKEQASPPDVRDLETRIVRLEKIERMRRNAGIL